MKTLAQLMDDAVTEIGEVMEAVMREQLGMTGDAAKQRKADTRAEVRAQLQGDAEAYAEGLKRAGLTDQQVVDLLASATRLRGKNGGS